MTFPQEPDPGRDTRAFPVLDAERLARVLECGVSGDVAAGQVVFRLGDETYDLVVVESGVLEVVREANLVSPEVVVATFGPGEFLGELGILTGQSVYLSARVATGGRICRVPPASFRSLMATDADISDVLLTAFTARRELLMGVAAETIDIIGNAFSAASMSLRTYVARQELPHRWMEADSPDAVAVMTAASLGHDDLPAVLLPGGRTVPRATPSLLAEQLGLTYRRFEGEDTDLIVIGAGPAGLAAAVYGSSEGLDTILLDAVGPGGQAAASSRIENYLGFPNGVSGAELTRLAATQALKFGTRIYAPCAVKKLQQSGGRLEVVLDDGTRIATRTVIVATGARYRALPLARWSAFEGAGIYYAATELEARSCEGRPVAVVGGANSAGQAALFLAGRDCAVSLVLRGPDLRARMSSYLVDRLVAHPRVTVRPSTEVTALDGDVRLSAITLTDTVTGAASTYSCGGLFCFIGAAPATDWLDGCAVDGAGFIRTDTRIRPEELGSRWQVLGRGPLPFETSLPGVFAAGDVRHGSMKRVASSVGEGATAVSFVHQVIEAHP